MTTPETNASVTELAICESEHLRLRIGQTYRFIVMTDCRRCREMLEEQQRNDAYSSASQEPVHANR